MMDEIRNIGAGLLLLLLAVVLQWPSFVAFGIQRDLHDYARAIQVCDQPLSDKERLLDLIDAMGIHLDNGAKPSICDWLANNKSIRAMLLDEITQDEIRLIERELKTVEKKLEPERNVP